MSRKCPHCQKELEPPKAAPRTARELWAAECTGETFRLWALRKGFGNASLDTQRPTRYNGIQRGNT